MNAQFDLLGPIAAIISGIVIWPNSIHVRALIALLAIRPGQYVSTDDLCAGLWDRPPDSAPGNLRSYASRLRTVLGVHRGLLTTRRGGARGASYALDVPPGSVDLFRFRDARATGTATPRPCGSSTGAGTTAADPSSSAGWRTSSPGTDPRPPDVLPGKYAEASREVRRRRFRRTTPTAPDLRSLGA